MDPRLGTTAIDQVLKNVVTQFNRSKSPTAPNALHAFLAFLLVLCLSINIFLTFSVNITTKFAKLKI